MNGFMVDNGYFADGRAWGIFYQGGNHTARMWWDDDEENIEYIADGSYDFCLKKIHDVEIDILVELKGV